MRNSYWALEWRLHWLPERRRRCYHRWLGVIFVLTLLCGLLLFQGVLGLRIVEGNSMYPSLMPGDLIIYRRWGYSLEYGDMIVLHGESGGLDIVKRVAALEGDELNLTLDGHLTRNHDAVDEPYARYGYQDSTRWVALPFEVPPDAVFYLGDNRPLSLDSRVTGSAELSRVEGKVIGVLRLFSGYT